MIRFDKGWGWLLAAGLLGPLPALAQARVGLSAPAGDSTRDRIFDRRRPVVQIDSRISIINSKFCNIYGLKAGMELPGRVRTGAAFYFLSSSIPTRLAPPAGAAEDDDSTLRFYNVALWGEYILIENPRWELGANLQTGLGAVQVNYTDTTNRRANSKRDFVGLVEPSLAAQMHLFSWFSLGAGAGWRQALFVPELERREISGPIFYLRGRLLLGQVWLIYRHHKPLFSQDGQRVFGLDRNTRKRFLR